MATHDSFPSLHARLYTQDGEAKSLYEIGKGLTHKQLQRIAHTLRAQGYPVDKIEFYEYGAADTLKHLFIWMEGMKEPIPYFELDEQLWKAMVKEIIRLA